MSHTDTPKTIFGIKIDNHLSVGHVFTTLSLVVAGTIIYANNENRLTSLEKADARIEREIEKQQSDYRQDMMRMEAKIDKIYETVVTKNRSER